MTFLNLYLASNAAIPGKLSAAQQYANLFSKDRLEIMRQLDELPDFHGLEELQLKVIFTVIVVSKVFTKISEVRVTASQRTIEEK